MWRLRRKTERGWHDGFHIHTGEEAKGLCDLLNNHERELAEARGQANDMREKWLAKGLCCEHLGAELHEAINQRDEARGQLAGIEDKMRVELGGHPDSELWGEAGLIAATMRCVDALGEVTDQRDKAQKDSTYWMAIADAARKDKIFWMSIAEGRGHTDETLSN
jgi:hypothetical protein